MKHPLLKPFPLLLGLALLGLAVFPAPHGVLAAAAKSAAAKSAATNAAAPKTAKTAPAASPAPPQAAPAKAIRPGGAIWVNSVGSFYRDTPRIGRFIEDLRGKPFHEAVIQVVENQSAFYNSALLPMALGVPAHFDPLLVLGKGLRAEPNPVRLIAWITPYVAGNVNRSAPLPPQHVTVAHPDWLSLRANGGKADASGTLYLEPGLPEVQQYLESMVRELVHQYPIDGIYFDLMGDPDADWGYHPAMLAAWRARTGQQGNPQPGDPTWIAFRAELIGKALDGLARAARSQRAYIMVSAGARTDGPPPASPEEFRQGAAYTRYHQDWPAWAAAAKPVTRLYLQDFKSEESEPGAFEGWLDFAARTCHPRSVQLVVGVAGYLNDSILTLGQMRKAVLAGVTDVALADYGKPVRDLESQSIFMTAVARTVLAPEYYDNIAAMARTAGRATSATLAEGAASTRTVAVALDRGPQRPRAGALPGADLALPPPPLPRGVRPDLKVGAPGGAAVTSATAAQAGDGEVRVTSQRVLANEPEDAMTTTSLPAPTVATVAATRRQMLEELVKDPEFSQSPDWTLIRPGDTSKAFLKEHYGNIFD